MFLEPEGGTKEEGDTLRAVAVVVLVLVVEPVLDLAEEREVRLGFGAEDRTFGHL